MNWASGNGYLEIVKYLHSITNITWEIIRDNTKPVPLAMLTAIDIVKKYSIFCLNYIKLYNKFQISVNPNILKLVNSDSISTH